MANHKGLPHHGIFAYTQIIPCLYFYLASVILLDEVNDSLVSYLYKTPAPFLFFEKIDPIGPQPSVAAGKAREGFPEEVIFENSPEYAFSWDAGRISDTFVFLPDSLIR